MSAVPALAPLRIVPIPRPRLYPAPLPGELFPEEEVDWRFVQESLCFDEPDEDEPSRPEPSLPDPETVAASLAQALVEVLAGRRPVVQMVRWTSPAVYAGLTARASVAHRRRLSHNGTAVRVTVRRVIVTRPRDDIAEVAIVVIDGSRVRAIAMQLRGADGRWCVEALQVG
ncbi:MAG: Rv3235 family protein [Dermatophilaceae bacterium]